MTLSIEQIKKSVDQLQSYQPLNKLFGSFEFIEALKNQFGVSHINIGGLDVYESPLLPVEIKYDACELLSRQEVKVSSGEFIHLIEVPDPEWEYEKSLRQRLDSYEIKYDWLSNSMRFRNFI